MASNEVTCIPHILSSISITIKFNLIPERPRLPPSRLQSENIYGRFSAFEAPQINFLIYDPGGFVKDFIFVFT